MTSEVASGDLHHHKLTSWICVWEAWERSFWTRGCELLQSESWESETVGRGDEPAEEFVRLGSHIS